MIRIAICTGLLALAAGCTDAKTAQRVLEDQGYTDVRADGYAAFSCSDQDTFKTAFTATSPSGRPVSGAVCSAWLKGATIRFD